MEDVENASMEQMKKMMNYPLIKNCDMTEEMRQDCSDLVITAVEKHANNFEAAARLVKEAMDKKYNESWVVVIGEGFSFEVTHQVKHVLWMYTSNSVAVLVYKGAPAACRFRATPTLRASACAPHVLLSVHRLLRSPSPACRVCAAGARQVGA